MSEEKKQWWVVFNPYEGKAPTVRHETEEEAQYEAQRICAIERKKVHVLELVGTAYPPKQTEVLYKSRRNFAKLRRSQF